MSLIPVYPLGARRLGFIPIALLTVVMLGMLPFAGALEVHHAFADVDQDGHEHSEFDLCHWVQIHGSGSVDFSHVDIGLPIRSDRETWGTSPFGYSSVTLISQESRGPPFLL